MNDLKHAINTQAVVKTDAILDVSAFLNEGIDTNLMNAIGKDFSNHFQDLDVDLFVTVESSGIAPAVFASLHAQKPLVVLKKVDDKKSGYLQQSCHSFTKNKDYFLTVKADFLAGKRIVLIDDFLAQGSVVNNVEILINNAKGSLVGVGICITKGFQKGYLGLLDRDFKFYSQVIVESMDPDTKIIKFEEHV